MMSEMQNTLKVDSSQTSHREQGISQAVSLPWYNQTGGTMTPQCLLHKTWFVCAEPEDPSCKFL